MRSRRVLLFAAAAVLMLGGSAAAATMASPSAHQVQRITFSRAQGQSVSCTTERHCHFDPGGRPMIANFSNPTAPFSVTVSVSYDYRVSSNAECLLAAGLGSATAPAGQASPVYRRIPRGVGSATAVFLVPDVAPSTDYHVDANIKAAARAGMHCALSKLVVTVDAES